MNHDESKKVSPDEIKRVLNQRLNLAEPDYDLEVLPNGKVSGSVISDTFTGMDDLVRLRKIWDALDAEFEKDAHRFVGTLLAYTQAEWNIDLTGSRNLTE